MRYTVYKHTSPSGKVYIGITKQRPEKRWDGGRGYKHCPHMEAAIQKYGWDNIQHEILVTGATKETAEAIEIAMIARYRANDRRFGYNTDRGGSTGAKHTPETRARIGAANHTRIWTPEARQKLREYKLAHPTTPETAKRIGEANRGRKHRPESIEKIRAAQPCRPVKNTDTGEVYESVQTAAKVTGLDASKIVAVCKGRRKTTGGFRWAYEEVIL